VQKRLSLDAQVRTIAAVSWRSPALASTVLILFYATNVLSAAQSPSAQVDNKAATELVRATVANETSANNKPITKLMYLSRKRTAQGSETRLNVETTDSNAWLLLERNNQPISKTERQQESQRLAHMGSSASELRRKKRLDREEADHSSRLLKALPDAFLYQFDGTESATENLGRPGDELVRLKFLPNPSYSPPSHVEQILAGMQGTLLVDNEAHRIARIDATLFKEVTFCWGVLGHLDKGGTFLVEQAEVAPGDWELTHTRLNLTGKIMMVKSLVIKSDETDSHFRPVPSDTTFPRGVELLEAEESKLLVESQKGEPDCTALNRNRH
jgi:hypothetical protein